MKIFYKVLFAALLLFGTEKLIRTQTDGFRFEKTKTAYSFKEEWSVSNDEPIDTLLDQSFTFLGSGVQCYAFLGEDQKTVLKVFKHHHFGLTTPQLENLPLPSFLRRWKVNTLKKRKKRVQNIFKSALLAKGELADETGVFHLNLNPQFDTYPTITIYDKIGVHYQLDLNTTPFLLQKKADLFFSYLNKHKGEAKNVIDSLFACIQKRTEKGIACSDDAPYKNFGIIDGNVVQIDVGSFFENPSIQNSVSYKRDLFTQTLEVKDWIQENAPEVADHFEQTIQKAIRT